MARQVTFVDDFFEAERRNLHEELKKIDKMSSEEKKEYAKTLRHESERLRKRMKETAPAEEVERFDEFMERMSSYQPPAENPYTKILRRVMREMKFVRNADLKKFGSLYFDIEEITDDVIVFTYDPADIKLYKYEYIAEHDSKLTCPWGEDYIEDHRRQYEDIYGHWQYTDEEYEEDREYIKKKQKHVSPENEMEIAEAVLKFGEENDVITGNTSGAMKDTIVLWFESLSDTEKKILLADIDLNTTKATNLRKKESITYAEYRQIKQDMAKDLRETLERRKA